MILVTGGTGLVGSHLLYSLVLSGEIPMALKRSTSDIFKIKKYFHIIQIMLIIFLKGLGGLMVIY